MRSSTPFPLLRTYLSTAQRRLRFILVNTLNLVSIALTVIGFSTQNLVIEILSVSGLLVGVIGIGLAARKSYKDIQDLYVEYLPALTPRRVRALRIPPRLQESDYQILLRRGAPSDALLTSGLVNRALFSGASSGLKVQKNRFRAPHPAPVTHVLLREFTQKRSVILFNGRKIRLAKDPMLSDDGHLAETEVQPTRYFDTMVTNDSLSVRVMSRDAHHPVFTGDNFCFPQRVIPACEQSTCANQVGASTIAVTSDDYMVVGEQGRRSNVAKSMLSPSGSGSADWKDVRKLTELQQLVENFAIRELMEECGLAREDVAWLRILGYGRFLHRGGLPQFFCLAKLNCSYAKIKVSRSERGLTGHRKDIDIGKRHYEGIQAAIKELRKEDYVIGSSLWWNLELLSQIPEEGIEKAFH